MKRLATLLLATACSSTAVVATSGNFAGPSGMAATSAGDHRDLLFIASSGNDEVRAITYCTTPLLAS